MKGGKGGQGRKRSTERVSDKATAKGVPKGGVKKGAAKKDWGAIPKDEDDRAPKRQPTRERT